MSEPVYITGIGIISAIGNGVPDTMDALKACHSGIGDIDILPSRHKGAFPAAEVKKSNRELRDLTGVDSRIQYSRTTLLGIIAAKEAFRHAGLDNALLKKTGLVSATTVGGMDVSEKVYKDFLDHRHPGQAECFRVHDCGDSTEKIAASLDIGDYVTTISTACSSSANAIMFGARLLKNRLADRIVAGGTDALSLFTVNGFNALMIIDKEKCRPFDKNRKGLTLGEGAGYLVLESQRGVEGREDRMLCELKGYGNTCDAYHQTASSPDGYGAYLAMKNALEMGRLNPGDVDYINAHGTGTANNDLSEGRAVQKLFGPELPPISSTKGYTGHTLGAAGGIEAVISVIAVTNGLIPPNLHFSKPMDDLNLNPVTGIMTGVDIQNVISNSFGFGGNNTTLLFSRNRL
jgi:3-oxoacyl-[acyl-carrier-protein] synthase-1